tara:strand:- start:2625 stop:3788 length:1164 start_codon:yes stop_codon:yes gene_type:complete
MKLQERKKDLIFENNNMEHLYTFKNFPVFMGCVSSERDQDLKSDMRWEISKKSGMIQLASLLPMDVVYAQAHGSGLVGSVWMCHHSEFAKFIIENLPEKASILEIGAQHGILADMLLSQYKGIEHWTIVEPNPNMIDRIDLHKNLSVKKGWFDENYTQNQPFDVIVHSHVFEHVLDPHSFVKSISDKLEKDQKCIFSIPNMKVMLEEGYTNCLNFEHTYYLSEGYVDYFANVYDLIITDKQYFKKDHSIFYSVKKTNVNPFKNHSLLKNAYEENKNLFCNYVTNLVNQVEKLNEKIAYEKQIYLFGAHVFSQYLINLGLNTKNVLGVLDNDPNKHHKRLYGTSLKVMSPEILKNKKDAIVILKAGVYTEEIRKQIIEQINSNVRFIL